MARKANFFSSDNNSDTMSRNEQEQYYTALKEDMDDFREEINQRLDHFREEVDQRLNRMEGTLQTVLDIVRGIDATMHDFKASLYEFDRRLVKVERHLFGAQTF